jgi:phosphoribosylformylglycinamidine cyclo-ligase
MYNPIKPSKAQILHLIQKTWKSPYLTITPSTYAIFKRKFDYEEVDHTDGIGTKGYYHWKSKTLRNAVIDALAMNLNDLAMVGAVPFKLQNHIVLPEDNTETIVEIVRCLVRECQKRNIAITGGETSIQNTSDGLDIGITVSGFIENKKINKFRVGDLLIGLSSSGLHSNGITKVREIFKKEIRKEFTVPTKIYSDVLLPLFKKYDLHGRMHITGGAFTKLKDLLVDMDAIITNTHRLKPQPIFYELYKRGVDDQNIYRTFNCGIGFIISVSPKDAKAVLTETKGQIIGKIVKGSGKVLIDSMFTGKRIEL